MSAYNRVVQSSAHASVIALDAPDGDGTDIDAQADANRELSWTFSWLHDLLKTAQERTLQVSDAPPLPKACATKPNAALLQEHWLRTPPSRPSASSPNSLNTFRLALAIFEIYGWEYMTIGVYLATSTLLGFAGPVMLHALVSAAEERAPAYKIAGYILGLFVSKIVVALCATRYSYCSTFLSISIGSAIKGCIFAKTLRLSTLSRQKYTAGNITNLYTVDVERVVGCATVLHNFWALPMQILVAMVLLWQVVSYAMFSGLTSIILVLIVNNYISVIQKRANDLIMMAKDERMKCTAECFGAMLIIKLNAWEPKFIERILKCREDELKHIWTMLFVSAFNICLLWLAPSVVSVSTILTYAKLMGAQVTAARVFTALSLFRMLQDPLRNLPGNITQFFQAISSLQRLQKFNDMADKGDDDTPLSELPEEIPALLRGQVCIPSPMQQVWFGQHHTAQGGAHAQASQLSPSLSSSRLRAMTNRLLNWIKLLRSRTSDSSGTVEMIIADRNEPSATYSGATVSPLARNGDTIGAGSESEMKVPIDTTFVLRLPAMNIKAGELVVISGIVGGGKSSIINGILQEMYSYGGGGVPHANITTEGTIAMASQQAWIRNATIKENILFGTPYDAIAYDRAIDACCLAEDFFVLTFGDDTYIGERGVNLSGGQKARIALARAVYADADIYLLDDVLAALDSIVARKVFLRCILGLLGGKTRILITHNEDVIANPAVDLHLVVTNGQVDAMYRCSGESTRNSADNSIFSCIQSIKSVDYTLAPAQARPVGMQEETEDAEEVPMAASQQALANMPRNYSFSGRSVCDDDDDTGDSPPAIPAKAARPPAQALRRTGNDNAQEERAEGSVDRKVYLSYIMAMGGSKVIIFLACVQTVWQCLSVGSDIFLSDWTRQSDAEQAKNSTKNAMLYAVLSLGSGSIVLVRTMTISTTGYRAAKRLFENMLHSLMRAPMSWLDKNPSGRLLNRFSDDQAKVDCNLPFAVGSVFATFFSVGGDLLTVCVITRYLAVLSIPIFFTYRQVMFLYLRASREIQRLQSMSQSPVLTAMSELVAGVTVVRAFGPATIQRLIVQNNALLDANGAMQFVSAATSSWFVLRIQLVGAFILLLITVLVFLGQHEGFLGPGLVGLSISYVSHFV